MPTGADLPALESPAATRRWIRTAWVTGGLLLVCLVVLVTRRDEERRLAALLREARPGWLVSAALLQAATYVCAALVWQRVLVRHGVRRRLRGLVPLGLAKLFTDQAVPSAGLSGTLLVVRALERRGVPHGPALAAMLGGLMAFYVAYALALAAALVVLWRLGELDRLVLALATLFSCVAAGVPLGIFWLRGRARKASLSWLRHWPGARRVLEALGEAPAGALFGPRLALETVALQLAIFALDSATLWVALQAIATPVHPAAVFASFVMASVVATLAWVPGGLGTFEASCVALLHLQGIPVQAALAGTLLLRGFTFWLPMAPGFWLARHELGA